MAKVAIVSHQPDETTWSLASLLHQQRQDVLLITGPSDTFDRKMDFQLITPFKKWSAFEALRTFGVLLQWNPEVLHFVFSGPKARPTRAHWVLGSAFSAVPGKAVAISSFSELNFQNKIDQMFLSVSKLSTFATRGHLMSIKRSTSGRQISEVFPPLDLGLSDKDFMESGNPRIRQELESLVKTLGRYLVFPQVPARTEIFEIFRRAGFEALVLQERFDPKSSFYTSGPISPVERNFIVQKSKALFLAGLPLSALELKIYQDLALRNQKALLVTPDQNETLPGLCWHGKSGWVLDQGLASLQGLLTANPYLLLNGVFQGPSHQEILDSNLNALLRLYSRALALQS